jgi:hypothetical protein
MSLTKVTHSLEWELMKPHQILVLGSFYYTNKYYLSLSVPNMLSSVHLDANGNKIGSETQHYFLTGGYVFDLSPNTELNLHLWLNLLLMHQLPLT